MARKKTSQRKASPTRSAKRPKPPFPPQHQARPGLEANIQPSNRRSSALVQGLGFRCEGNARGLLKIGMPTCIQQLLFSGGFTMLFWIVAQIGTAELAAFLIHTPQGHILIDTGMTEMHDAIASSVEQLGYRMADIRILLASHAHFDHIDGHALMQRRTGAQVMDEWLDAAAGVADDVRAEAERHRVADAEHEWRESNIYAVDVASGAVRQLTTRKGPDSGPVPSPDGKRIAFVAWVWPELRGTRAQARRFKEFKERKETAYVSDQAWYRWWDRNLPMGRVAHLHVLDLQDDQYWIDTIKQRYEQPLLRIFEQ